jgi:hypothetical protein
MRPSVFALDGEPDESGLPYMASYDGRCDEFAGGCVEAEDEGSWLAPVPVTAPTIASAVVRDRRFNHARVSGR